jgi:sulfur relay (sulfurtransferase) DsrF/TusC family protein
MMKKRLLPLLVILVLLAATNLAAQQKTILFDAAHAQTAGNADWTLDEDSCGTAQRFPTPDQAGITSSTAETYWNGAHSAMGVDLVKKGFHVESLPVGARISYGDGTNVQDLSHYNVFVMPEPNIALTSTEITAIRNFVFNGGGLFMISDHAGADRNSDGIDAAGVFNALMGSPSIFGITYNDNSSDSTFGWFDDHPDVNYTTDTTSKIIWAGAFGVPSSTKGLGLFGSSSMTLSGAAKGHVWKTTSTHDTSSGVTYATSTYGSGRVAAIADSSVTEDATNSCSHSTFLGYNDPSYDNGLLVANGIAWLANGTTGSDTTPPTASITAPANGATVSGTVSVTATASDNVGVTKVEFYLDGVLQSTDTTSPYAWSWNTTTATNATHSLTAKAYDAANNIGTSTAVSVTVNNIAGDTTPPTVSITAPVNGATVSGTISVTASASDNVGVTKVEFYLDGVLQSTDTTSPYAWSWDTTTAGNASHTLTAKAYDAANNIGTSSAISVTANNVVPGTDISGWTVTQANATVVYTIPAGTIIPANGYVVIGRDATKAAFQTFWGVTLASNVVYLTTAGAFPQINGSENYTLKNGSGTTIDGPTISTSSSANESLKRIDPCTAANITSNWNIGATTTATPGTGAGAGCAKGVVINEFSDAAGSGNFIYEFVELHNDK